MAAIAARTIDLEQLTAHLTLDQRDELDARIATISADEVTKFVESLNSRPFEDSKLNLRRASVWSPEKFEEIQMISYKALTNESISLEQFVTCSLVSFALEQFKARFLRVSISEDPSLSKEDKQIVSNEPEEIASKFKVISEKSNDFVREMVENFIRQSYSKIDITRIGFDNFAEEITQKLSDRIDHMPRSEQLFFSYKVPLDHVNKVSFMLNVLVNYVNLPFLIFKQEQSHFTITFPSFSIIKALLDVSSPGGVTLVPVFGRLSTIDIRRYLLKGDVPINLKLPIAPLLKEGSPTQWADGFAAGPFAYAFHDIYHAWIKAKLSPDQLRKAQGLIRSLVDFRKKLLKIRDKKGEMTEDVQKTLEKHYLSCSPEQKVIKAIRQLNIDIWNLSDMDVKTLNCGYRSNIKSLYDNLSGFSQMIIDDNIKSIGVTQSELMGIDL